MRFAVPSVCGTLISHRFRLRLKILAAALTLLLLLLQVSQELQQQHFPAM